MKLRYKILIGLLIIPLTIIWLTIYALYFSQNNLDFTYITVESDKIDESMDNVQISFISDLCYNNYMDYDRLNSVINKINNNSSDVIVFGGDLFDKPLINTITPEVQEELTQLLKEINAPLGKFAVLGEQDLVDQHTKDIVTKILTDANFEIITNSSITISNKTTKGITLYGLDSLDGGKPNIDILEEVSKDTVNIVVTHAPDLVERLKLQNIDLVLAGHTHGKQIDIPFFKFMEPKKYGERYIKGSYYINNTQLYVSNGIGNTDIDARLFSPSEVVVVVLQKT